MLTTSSRTPEKFLSRRRGMIYHLYKRLNKLLSTSTACIVPNKIRIINSQNQSVQFLPTDTERSLTLNMINISKKHLAFQS